MALSDGDRSPAAGRRPPPRLEETITEIICSRDALPAIPGMTSPAPVHGNGHDTTEDGAPAPEAAADASTGPQSQSVATASHRHRTLYRWSDPVRVRVIKVLAHYAKDVGSSLSLRKEEIEHDVAEILRGLPQPPPQPLTFSQIVNMLTTAKRWDAQHKGSADMRAAMALFEGRSSMLERQAQHEARPAAAARARGNS